MSARVKHEMTAMTGAENEFLLSQFLYRDHRCDVPDRGERCLWCKRTYDETDLLVVETEDPSLGSLCLQCWAVGDFRRGTRKKAGL